MSEETDEGRPRSGQKKRPPSSPSSSAESRPQPQIDQNSCPATKRRKTTRPDDGSRFKILGPLHLPDLFQVHGTESESQRLNQRLASINRRLRSHRSKTLMAEKQAILEALILKNPTFSPPSDHKKNCSKKRMMFKRKLYLPSRRFPFYNFVGLLIGPKGRTQKQLERETGARIQLRGRGCGRKHSRPEDEEDPHVVVEADDERSLTPPPPWSRGSSFPSPSPPTSSDVPNSGSSPRPAVGPPGCGPCNQPCLKLMVMVMLMGLQQAGLVEAYP